VPLKRRSAVRKKTSAEVRKWADAFEHCAHGIAMGDPTTHLVIACNPAFARMLGRTAQEVTGTPIIEVYAAPERARARLRIAEADRTGRASFESAFQRADGSIFPVHVDLVSVHGGGRTHYRIATVQDLTERRRVEQTRDTLARAIENAAIEMVLCDPQDRVVLASRSFREGNAERLAWLEPGTPYADYLREGLRRGTPMEAIGREDAWIAKRLELRRRGRQSFEQHLREDRWILVTDHRLPDGSTLTSGVDISRQKRAQRALAESERKLRDANAMLEMRVNVRTEELASVVRELEAFTYSVSHDLRAPLGAINGFAHLLNTQEGSRLTEDGRKLLQFVEANASRMAELLEGLLDFSRLGRGAVAQQPVSMDALVREVLKEQQAADKAEIRLGHLPDCVGDALLLKQVWANLIGNALKYSHGRAPAIIEIGFAEGPPAYHVRDNGAGFDMRHADKLFGVFERLHNDSEFEGTGLGLAIVERIVRRHGGRVWAESQPGAGAAFFFALEA
jgi:PAS domain S-box-containing protein